jgi:hypothetical protein
VEDGGGRRTGCTDRTGRRLRSETLLSAAAAVPALGMREADRGEEENRGEDAVEEEDDVKPTVGARAATADVERGAERASVSAVPDSRFNRTRAGREY